MAAEPEELDFDPAEPAAVLARMDEVAAAGKGWVNFQPAVDADQEPPPRTKLFGLFSNAGPDVPLCTWVPGQPTSSIGVQHATGPKAADRLKIVERGIPDGWRVRQDHPKRGLVVEVPGGVPNSRVLDWLLDAGTALSTMRLTGRWRAIVYAR
ncbi:MAG TPA: hypothetical protein VJ010_04830 [Actinomycetota bacterium]|nr:hypothetical protein [Actinomycetota bacterium]